MTVSINVIGVPKVQAMLKLANSKVTLVANSAIKQAGFFMEGEVKDSIAGHRAESKSVDTGRFLSSVHSHSPKPGTAIVQSLVEYADKLEFGTSKFGARHHFRNSAKRNETKLIEFVSAKIKAVI